MNRKDLMDNIYNVVLFTSIVICFLSAVIFIGGAITYYLSRNELSFEALYAAGFMFVVGTGLSIYFIKINSIKK